MGCTWGRVSTHQPPPTCADADVQGNLRWRSPQPVQPWSGELNATWWGPGCIQTEKLWNLYTGSSEGCLYLNIYVPTAAPPPGGYPVMLFLHGTRALAACMALPAARRSHRARAVLAPSPPCSRQPCRRLMGVRFRLVHAVRPNERTECVRPGESRHLRHH
ncbi:hypothetical protein EON67_02345 [archaeon]|nr:MAG: hypothetical protein EON67_02345 [archaeon]